MRADQLQQIAQWLAATDIELLELRGPEQSLRLRNDGGAVDAAIPGGAAPSDAGAVSPLHDVPNSVTVSATSVGVFLHRHPLRDDALAEPGTPVQAAQALGLLRIGPLLMPVGAPAAGTVLELLASHGTTVGYGTPLVTLADTSPC